MEVEVFDSFVQNPVVQGNAYHLLVLHVIGKHEEARVVPCTYVCFCVSEKSHNLLCFWLLLLWPLLSLTWRKVSFGVCKPQSSPLAECMYSAVGLMPAHYRCTWFIFMFSCVDCFLINEKNTDCVLLLMLVSCVVRGSAGKHREVFLRWMRTGSVVSPLYIKACCALSARIRSSCVCRSQLLIKWVTSELPPRLITTSIY